MSASNHLASYDQYENLKQILRPEYAALPPAEIEALMEGMFGPGATYTTFNTIKGTAVGKSIAVPIFNYRNVGHKQHARPGGKRRIVAIAGRDLPIADRQASLPLRVRCRQD